MHVFILHAFLMLLCLPEIYLPSFITLINPYIKTHLGQDDLQEVFPELHIGLAAHLLLSHSTFISYHDQMQIPLSCTI